MQDRQLFAQILGISAPWRVAEVTLNKPSEELRIRLEHDGSPLACPECGGVGPGYDRTSRRWRHLDTCQYQTILEAEVPRMQCPAHGVRQVRVAWAEDRSRFTMLFERLAIQWLLEANRSAVARQMRLTWDEADGIMRRAVERGLARRKETAVRYLGVDEKSFQKHHEYVTVVCDLEKGHVLHVGDDRKQATLDVFYKGLTEDQLAGIEAVAMDMWDPYVESTCQHVPKGADKIVYDRFHIAKHLGAAVDTVRKQEHRVLQADGDDRLKRTKYKWLRNPENFSAEAWESFASLRRSTLRTARAWSIKEMIRGLWTYSYRKSAETFFSRWYGWAVRSRLPAMAKAARMMKERLPNILTYLKHRITNAMSESLNSKIQWIKYTARGFRNRDGFRRAIYFHCGGLALNP